ncbi:MAG: EscU/YscU/HrcU family type III secretion system export apparatus switch protein [Deltaproteobacteria bacterium]|jgi:flagellar biosynthesis protein|nr:EscU/YscU/HrcU family type III secretion system export apparatus switch protein [Deltaproteobacteria bacterium]
MKNKKKSSKAAAITYDAEKDRAPRLVAKGSGPLADKIIEIARQHDIHMVKDENLVQVLEALDLDTEIPPELYRAVAEVLAFIYRLNNKL